MTLNSKKVDFIYKYHTQVLTVENLSLSLDKPFKLTWHYPVPEEEKDEEEEKEEKYNKLRAKTVDCVNNEKPCTINDWVRVIMNLSGTISYALYSCCM